MRVISFKSITDKETGQATDARELLIEKRVISSFQDLVMETKKLKSEARKYMIV